MAGLLQKIMGNAPVESDISSAGHNNPPSDMDILQERMQENNAKLLTSARELIKTANALPKIITTKEEAGDAADIVKQLTGTAKMLEAARVAEKEPYLALTRAVDGFFRVPADWLKAAKDKVQAPLTDYLQREAMEQRRRRDAEAKRLQDEADAQMRAAVKEQSSRIGDIGMIQASVTEQQAAHMQASVTAKPAELARARGTSGALAGLRSRWIGEIADREALNLEALRPYLKADALQMALNAFVAAGNRHLAGARIYEKTDGVVR